MNTGAEAQSNMTLEQWEKMCGALVLECHRDERIRRWYYYYKVKDLKGNSYVIQVSFEY